MQTPYKVLLANIILVILFSLIYAFLNPTDGRNDFAVIFGLVCLLAGLINLILGIVFLFIRQRDWRVGFFISCAVLFVLSGISCGSSL